jgi:hypothetical protein
MLMLEGGISDHALPPYLIQQVLQTLHDAEQLRTTGAKRNILQVQPLISLKLIIVDLLKQGPAAVAADPVKQYQED